MNCNDEKNPTKHLGVNVCRYRGRGWDAVDQCSLSNWQTYLWLRGMPTPPGEPALYCVCGSNYRDRWISDKERVKTLTVTLRQDTGSNEYVITERWRTKADEGSSETIILFLTAAPFVGGVVGVLALSVTPMSWILPIPGISQGRNFCYI